MNTPTRIGIALTLSSVLAGCANQNIKAPQILCPLVGATTGAGVVAAAADSDDAGAYVAGAAIGGALGYFFCREEETPPPAPAPAPAPAPKPAPPPPPPPPPAPEEGTKIISLEGTHFDFDKATLRPEAMTKLDEAVGIMNEHAAIRINVEGHTDSMGSDAYNQKLSDQRSASVVSYLLSKGIAADRMSATGFGESRPVASNETAEGRAKNRRVDLIVAE